MIIPTQKLRIGWREVIALPDLGLKAVRVKVDSGARTSALHAEDIDIYLYRGHPRVHFKVCLDPNKSDRRVSIDAALVERRVIRSSIGLATHRPVILTQLKIGPSSWPIEVTLVNRDLMGFPMLLGRTAIRGRFLIDPGRSFLQTPEKYQIHRKKPRK